MTGQNPQNQPHHGRVPWRVAHRLQFKVAVTALVLAVVAALSVVGWVAWPRPPDLITDGGTAPTRHLEGVSAKIKHQNDWVRDQKKPWVSLAVMMPMDPTGSTVSLDSVRHTLEGIHLAQVWANASLGGKLALPLIRVLLVDDGKVGTEWKEAVNQISDSARSEHLAAVVGLGVSIDTTRAAIDELSKRKIAMVGSSISADDIKGIRGLVRVVPPNLDQVIAVLRHLDEMTPAPAKIKAVVVQDTNPADAYALELGKDFTDQFALKDHPILSPDRATLQDNPLRYDSSLAQSATVLSGLADKVCAGNIDTVLFAGRGVDLPSFLSPLAAGICSGRQITVLTGDDAEQLVTGKAKLWNAQAAPNLNVYYAASAYPDAWTDTRGYYSVAATQEFGAAEANGFKNLFPSERLEDGSAIMAHDGAATAIQAIRSLAGTAQNPGRPAPRDGTGVLAVLQPTADAVANELTSVAFQGASGWISFDRDNNPINKAIPILQLFSTGKVTFLKVTSRTGKPTRP